MIGTFNTRVFLHIVMLVWCTCSDLPWDHLRKGEARSDAVLFAVVLFGEEVGQGQVVEDQSHQLGESQGHLEEVLRLDEREATPEALRVNLSIN